MRRAFDLFLWSSILVPVLASAAQVAPVEPVTGEVVGQVFSETMVDSGACAIEGQANVVVELIYSTLGVAQTAATNEEGSFRFPRVVSGSYVLRATDRTTGLTASTVVQVAGGSVVRRNFVADHRAGGRLRESYAATLVTEAGRNPDLDRDDLVDFDDLTIVKANVGRPASQYPGDLNLDGRIDTTDVQAVRGAFGRSALLTSYEYAAEVTPGGSVASLGEGLLEIETVGGHTSGRLEAGSEPGLVRFRVREDRGTATLGGFGEFTFSEVSEDPTWVEFSLDTGRVVAGRLTLSVTGGLFEAPYAVEGDISDGIITLAPGGFSAYNVPNVTGTLEGFPVVGTVAYRMKKGEDSKKDKACETVTKPPGDPLCPLGGTACQVNATCAKNGKCGKCLTTIANGVCVSCTCGPVDFP